ncbi:MAG: AAA family ATPase [Planctomycetia bacterium]|nr:AAA family ATPase [Planctomycetia bacterium]
MNALRGLIETYQATPGDTRPLSIAVFGPPGSGKSFAIKQLAAAMFGKDQQTLEFNLSQFAGDGTDQLHGAFHRVRDASIKGAIPLVFWDEFDSDDLKWLKHFLAPMQDAEFRAGSGIHPFGKAIFVFAGGTCATFNAFDRSDAEELTVQTHFRGRKGPDFVSRLRGFVNIKGPNPSEPASPESDPEYLIRRAMILRSLLERAHGGLIDPKSKMANVSTRVVRAFLRVEQFRHGARSLESVLHMSSLRGAASFDVAQLTTPEQLGLHVTPDFMELARPKIGRMPRCEMMTSSSIHCWWTSSN